MMTNSHLCLLLSVESYKQVLIKKDYDHGRRKKKEKRKNLQFFFFFKAKILNRLRLMPSHFRLLSLTIAC